MSQCSVALLSCRRSCICVGSLVTYVCVCGGVTSLGFSVDWTISSLSRVDLSGLSWHRSCPGHLWEAAVVWARAYFAVYLSLCLAIKRRVLQYRVISTPWKHSRVLGYPPARFTTSTNVDDSLSVTVPGYAPISIIVCHFRFDPPMLLPCTRFIVTEASSRKSSLESMLLLAGLPGTFFDVVQVRLADSWK